MNENVDFNVNVKGIKEDSRQVKPGDLFIAMQGFTQDGRAFIQQAIDQGAVAVLKEVESVNTTCTLHTRNSYDLVPIIPYHHLRDSLGFIASRFYGEPSLQLEVIGVTGTNGKTSCTHFMTQLLLELGVSAGVMGTIGMGFLEKLSDYSCTTLNAIETQAVLDHFQRKGASVVSMEVTSHALTQGRVNGVHFKTGIFTNLTREHLDYHQTMENYWLAKKMLFTEFTLQNQIINLEDPYGMKLWEELGEEFRKQNQKQIQKQKQHQNQDNPTNLIGFTTQSKKDLSRNKDFPSSQDKILTNIITTENLILDDTGIHAFIETPWGSGEIHCQLFGRFNVSNILAAIAAVCLQGFPLKQVLEKVPKLKTVPGRMMEVKFCQESRKNLYPKDPNVKYPKVVIDYAHTPDALTQILSALRFHCRGKLWCVFGCGGERDPGKRPLMAKVAESLSDKVILTQDNPRRESPEKILQDVLSGFSKPDFIHLEPDRALAIQYAIHSAKEEDWILIAGKGHEKYQIIGSEKIPFNDQEIALQAFG